MIYVTASGIAEFTYCPKQWKLSKEYGKFSREELERKMATLKSEGRESAPEFSMFQRMIAAGARMDAGTEAHGNLAREVRAGRQAGDMSLWIALAAAALAAFAIYLFLK